MPYPEFDLSTVANTTPTQAEPLFTAQQQLPLDQSIDCDQSPGAELVKVRQQGGATLFLADEKIITAGVGNHLAHLLEQGLITHLAVNPVTVILDFELATTGIIQTTNRAQLDRKLLETIHSILSADDQAGLGYGEALGKVLFEGDFPHTQSSLLAQAYRWGVPVTVHAVPGTDPLLQLSDFDAAAWGQIIHRDFLLLCNSAENLEQGLVCQLAPCPAALGALRSALQLARQAASKYNRTIADFDHHQFLQGTTVTGLAIEGRNFSHPGSLSDTIPALRASARKSAGWDD